MRRNRAEAIKASVTVSSIVGRHVELRQAGAEWRGLCPFHKEDTASFTVRDDQGFFHCFGCGAHGDVIDFVQRIEGIDFRAAVERLQAAGPTETAAPARPRRTAVAPILPAPADAPEATFRHARLGEPSRVWTYRAADGRVNGYVCRFDLGDGKKEVLPRHWIPGQGWSWVSAPKPRPLYGLDLLAQRPDVGVVVVEGEKTADAARPLFPSAVVVTWPGGTGAVKHADWRPLAGRRVIVWPDCDRQVYRVDHARAGEEMPPAEQPGIIAAHEIAEILRDLRCTVRIVEVHRAG